MFTSQSNRGFVLTILTSLILALGIVYVILSVEQQSGDTGSQAAQPVRFSQLAGEPEPPVLGTDFVFNIFLNVDPSAYRIASPALQTIQQDIAMLRERRAERTAALVEQAEREYTDVYAMTMPSGQTLQEYLAASGETIMTEQMLSELLPEIEEYARRLQTNADGPHVSQLDADLPAFTTPVVPSYPSLPTMRAELVALVMADLDPDNAAVYTEAANGFARRLEVAGVAYPAANAAAAAYARTFVDVVQERAPFRTLEVAAAAEWEESDTE